MNDTVEISRLRYNELLKAESELKSLPYWRDWEDEALMFGVKRGHNRKEIAATIGKTPKQLSARLYILRESGRVL